MGTTAVEQKQIGRAVAKQGRTEQANRRKFDAAWDKIFDGLRELTALGVLLWAKPSDAYRLELRYLAAAVDSDFADKPATGSPMIAVTREYGGGVATWKFVGRGVQPLFRAVQKSTEPRTRTRDHDVDHNEPEIDDDKIPF